MSRHSQPRDRVPPEVNPYASPTVAGGYHADNSPGIGVWCDGTLLVIHKRAALPSICIATGEPAFRYRPFVLDWTYSIDLFRRQLQLPLPLSKDAYRRYRKRENLANAAIVLPLLALVLTYVVFGSELAGGWYFALVCCIVCGMCFSAIIRGTNRRPIRFVSKQNHYLWIAGADPRFLAQLPPWSSEPFVAEIVSGE